MGADGKKETHFSPRYLAKTDIDRVADASRAEVIEGLHKIAEKLYKRNPKEWKKSNQADRQTALLRLFPKTLEKTPWPLDFPELAGRREGAAALFAFHPDYAGDRVLGVIAGLLGMADAAFENKGDFYIFDSLDEQKLYNCARNFEIAIWKMSASRDADGNRLLISNELDVHNPNLSFEREFGGIIAILDVLAKIVADKQGRSISRVTQNLATAVFLPVSLLGF